MKIILATLLLADVALASCSGCNKAPHSPTSVPVGSAAYDAGWEPLGTGGTAPVAVTGGQAARVCNATVRRAGDAQAARARGKVKAPRIVGGQISALGAWPASVALETTSGFQYCGATLFGSGRCALTAAHCDVRPGEHIVAGLLDLRKPGGRIPVAEVRTHELYRSVDSGYDAAVLVLESNAMALPAGFVVSTARLAPAGWTGIGLPATVVGWGLTTEGGSASSVQRAVTVPIISAEACRKAYPGITDTMLCAGLEEGGKDSCAGDSGGAVYTMIDGVMVNIATVSWGEGCARPKYPGVYASVAALRPWIDDCSEDCR